MPPDPPGPRPTGAARLPPEVAAGAACAWCRKPFVQPHGHPVYCARCWDRAVGARKSLRLLPRAEHPLQPSDPAGP